MNRNVLKWLTDEAPDARHAVILTHNLSFLFVQGILLPRLRAAGDPRLTIFADAGCATGAWRQDRELISGLGVQFRVVPVDLGPWRRFHPKALLLASDTRAALATGSGNLTHGGMGSNREAWVFSGSEGGGASRIAAFRDYLAGLIDLLPLPDPLRESVDAIFDARHPWVAQLPDPTGLATAPSSPPLLDQLAGSAGEVRAVTVLAPYHDDRGEALGEIARRFRVPVTALLQPGHVGLWAGAASRLPEAVSLKSVQVRGERPAFIHAKVLALHRADDVLLAVGSANCSRAALLSDASTGNAELMAWDIVSNEVVEELFADLVIDQDALELPSERPSEEWPEVTRESIRVLAAHLEAGELAIAFSPNPAIREMSVEAEGIWPVLELSATNGLARLSMPIRARTIRLRAVLEDGTLLESPEAWVDDEISLSAPASLRRVLKRLSDTEAHEGAGVRDYQAVLEIFNEYLRDPEAARHRVRVRQDQDPPAPYDPSAVFDDGFGDGGVPIARGSAVGSRPPVSVLSIVEMLFNVGSVASTPRDPVDRGEREEEDSETQDGEVPDDQVLPSPPTSVDARTTGSVRRAIDRIERALLEPGFVEARAPALLGADLGLAAMLLVMGLSRKHLDVETFRSVTRRLWGGLFFGSAGHPGTIAARLSDGDDQHQFLAEFVTPRLAAALGLWCVTEWSADDDEALWFRLSAARLQSRWPALFAAGSPETMVSELRSISSALLPPNEQLACIETWRNVVRMGQALELLLAGLSAIPRQELPSPDRDVWLEPSDLVWTTRGLAFPIVRCRHDPSANIAIRVLGSEREVKFKGAYIFPIRMLTGVVTLEFPETAMPDIRRLVGDFESAETVALKRRAGRR